VSSQLRSGVQQIFSNELAFAALKNDGSVFTWGDPESGGNSSGVASQLRSGVQQIFSTGSAFAALKSDGSVVTWGDPSYGGNSSGVDFDHQLPGTISGQLQHKMPTLYNMLDQISCQATYSVRLLRQQHSTME
jgi:alpha-tubulin suppressor-like RCC1 family protein